MYIINYQADRVYIWFCLHFRKIEEYSALNRVVVCHQRMAVITLKQIIITFIYFTSSLIFPQGQYLCNIHPRKREDPKHFAIKINCKERFAEKKCYKTIVTFRN